ncbi:MAG: LysE family translocator, partial [Chloroflexi bacterium]|nr:LysE family translocator [Chloroflexota bacterium]
PGADTAVVTRATLAYGRKAALCTTVGINTGVMLWAAASAVGLAALLSASAVAFTVIKLIGAAYLVYLGILSLNQARRHDVARDGRPQPEAALGQSSWATYRQGIFTNLLNPKVGVFYTTFLPQFISPGENVILKSMLLAGIHNLMGFLWLTGYAYLVARAGDVLRRPAVRATLDKVTGVVLIAFGLRLALERR